MSLLDKGVPVTLRRAEPVTSPDGNIGLRALGTAQVILASVQPISVTENDAAGYFTEERYRLRPARNVPEIPATSEVDWNGETWTVEGPGRKFSGSAKTARYEYVLVRN